MAMQGPNQGVVLHFLLVLTVTVTRQTDQEEM